MGLIECYDVGGTNLRGAIFDSASDKILSKKIVKTKKSAENFLEQLKSVSNSLRSSVKESINLVSLAVPGPVEGNILLEAPTMGIKEEVDFSSMFSENVLVLNDMDAAVLAEKHFGWGKNITSLSVVTISTGIGVGTLINGQLIPGGEYGHDVLERNGPICSCGRRGCWVALCSGYAIKKATGMNAESFFKQDNEKTRKLIKKMRDYNAQGFGNIINAVRVEKIVVSGSIGLNQFEKIIPSKEEIKKYTINKIPDIVPTKLGDNIGLLGAYVYGKKGGVL